MIYALLADGFEEIEAIAVVDILRRADLCIKTVSVNKTKNVTGAHGIEVVADICISEMEAEYDMIFLPGGYPGYENLGKSEDVLSVLNRAVENDKYIAAICAAPSILGREGFLKGKKACCFPSFEKFLDGAEVVYDEVVISGKIITSRGAGTAHKLAFKIIEIFKGTELGEKTLSAMLY